MQQKKGKLLFSPSDLITFMESPYASAMERLKLTDPDISSLMDNPDTMLSHLQKKGYEHEDKFTATLAEAGYDIVVLETKRASKDFMASETIRMMAEGRDVIAQGYLKYGEFAGFSDYLKKVPGASKFGDYHYEVWDTKLSKKLKPYFAIQLCCYVEMLEIIQGVRPKHISVVLGNNKQEYLNVDNYYAYYQSLKKSFLDFHENFDHKRPDPAIGREYGRWSTLAKTQLAEQDHLSQVAGLSSLQIKNLAKAGITTMQQLSDTDLPSIPKMTDDVYERAKAQTRHQIVSRGLERPKYTILPHPEGKLKGLALLPPHSDMDTFFDIEGCPSADGGIEYLWGNTYFDENGNRTFIDFWCHNPEQEKQCFIDFINWTYDRWLKDPTMHVYHYANYEISAIRKLMGRYGVCEEKVDNLLRNNVFVDLYKVVRHGIIIGTPNYSIKSVELIYRGKRDTEVANGGESIIVYENWRENPDGMTWQTSKILNSIRDYNIDDCDSTQELTIWLREEQAKHGIEYLIPQGEGEAELPEEVTETTQLRDQILTKADAIRQTDEKHCTLLETLAYSLEFHRRENKPTWWRLFDRMGWSPIELYDDMDCLATVTRTAAPPEKTSNRKNAATLWQYSFDPNQPFKGTVKSFHVLGEDGLRVTVDSYDPAAGIITLKTTKEMPETVDLIPDEYVRPEPIPSSIKAVVENLMDKDFQKSAITDFLTRSRPRVKGNKCGPLINLNDNLLEQVITTSINLDNSYLCIQGPPGAGKTYTAKHIIGELLKQGKRVGISSNSHKAILNLMTGVADYVDEESIPCSLIKAGGDKNDPAFDKDNLSYVGSVKGFITGRAVCFGGTAWAFSNEAAENQFDYLFIDEAGQVSVANLIGMSKSSKNIIIMGDQMQLGQPIQGSHPGESGMSILEYLLEDHATIPDDLGVFLPKTYRMHPNVCSLISHQVYEGRLSSDDKAQKHKIQTQGPLITKKAGICFIPVEHEGNAQASDEEVAQIKILTEELLGCEYWSDDNGAKKYIGWEDILFVAPYNYQVNKLHAALGDQARIGSVDKFQGQEAPIVILSMCTSDAAESPRGIDFLFSKNRLNVALSRAQALAIVVGNPSLANTPVNNLKQMELINFYCEIVENNE